MQQTVGSGMFLQVMYRILLVKRVVNKVCLHEFLSSHLAGCFFVLYCFVLSLKPPLFVRVRAKMFISGI